MATSLSICLISQEFPPFTNWGGVGVQFDTVARALSAAGHRVVVVSRACRGAPAYERLESGIDVWRVGVPLQRKLLVGRTIDRMLHARSVAAKVRALDATHHFDVVEAPEAGLDAEVLLRERSFVHRTIVSCHGSNRRGQAVRGFLAPAHQLDWAWSYRRERHMLHRVRMIIVNSEATRREVLRNPLVDPRHVEVVPLGIDTTRFHPTADRPTGGPLVVGFVGRLQEDKGIDFVWRVVEQLDGDPGIRFDLKGAIHAASRSDVPKRLARYGARVTHHPPGTYDEMPAFFRSLDVLLLPSRFESFGLTYVEAMATELVVFAGHAGSGPEIVSDGVNGFLVDPDGSVEIVVARLRALAADRAAFGLIGKAAREEVLRRFSIGQFVSEKLVRYRRLSG